MDPVAEALAAARAQHLRRCALLARLIQEHTNYTPYVREHHYSSNCVLAVERAMQLWAAAAAPPAAAARGPWPELAQWARPAAAPAPAPETGRREVARCLRLEAPPVHPPDV
jgi:hypothetical protein